MKLAIFITTACRNKQDATNDTLYAKALVNQYKGDEIAGVRFLEGIYSQEEIFAEIEQNSKGTKPILHIILNSERKNNLFSIASLHAFKSRGGKIVITFADFNKFRYATERHAALNYLYCADHVHFLDESDKKAALECVKHHFPSEKTFVARLEKTTELQDVYRGFLTETELKGKQEAMVHAFKTWRNMPLTVKHACIQEARSFGTMYKIQGIDTIARANRNYKALVTRLKNLEGPYSDAMKQHLLAQNIGVKGYLTKEEKVFLKRLLDSNWTLKHVTEHIKEIAENGNQLLSVEERKRREDQNTFSHTPALEGNADNVFFSFGPGDIPTVRFLDNVDTYVEANYKELIQDFPNPDVENNALHGFWSSDHFYAYGAEQDGEPIIIYGSRYFVNYRKVVDVQSGQVRWVKNCHFIHPDGKSYIQTVEKGDEIFMHPRVDIALILLTIEKIRLLGLQAWQKIMQEKDLKALQSLVYTIYHTGVFEVHKPEQFLLDQPGVQVKTRQAKQAGNSNALDTQGKDLLKAAFTGNIDYIMKELADGTDIDKSYALDFPSGKLAFVSITLLSAAILGGQYVLVKKLLNKGATFDNRGTNLSIPTGPTSSFQTFISILTCVSFTTAINRLQQTYDIYTCLQKSVFGEQAFNWDYKKIAEDSHIILKMLLEEGGNIKDNQNIQKLACLDPEREFAQIYSLAQPDENIMLYLIQHLPDKAPDQALIHAVRLQHYNVAKKLLALGADPNQEFNSFHQYSMNGLDMSSTPLLLALDKNDFKMLQLLVQHKADVNKAYYEASGEADECPSKITEKTGQTPLMFAIEKCSTEIVQFLLENNADILKQTLSGLNALEFARKLCKNDIEKILLEKLLQKKLPTDKAESKLAKEAAQLTIYDHRVYIIAKAKDSNNETFFLLNKNKYYRTVLDHLHDAFLHSYNEKEWITDFKQQASAAFNFNDLKCIDYTEIQMGVNETGTHYIAKFIVCDFGIQNEAFFFAMKASDEYDLLGSTELMQETSEARLANRELTFKYNDQIISDLEAYLFLQLQGEIQSITAETQGSIQNKFYQQIQEQFQIVNHAKAGNIKAIDEIRNRGISLDFILPYADAEKFKQNTHGNKHELISFSPIGAALAHKQYDCALDLYEHGIDANKRNEISLEILYSIVAAGHIKLFKELQRQQHWSTTQHYEGQLTFECIRHKQVEFLKLIFSTAKIVDSGRLLSYCDTIRCFCSEIIALICEKAQDSDIINYLSGLSSCYGDPGIYFSPEEIKKFKENAAPNRVFDSKTEDEILKIFQHLLPRVNTIQTWNFQVLMANAVIYQNPELAKLVLYWKSKDKEVLTPAMIQSALLSHKLYNTNQMKHLDFYAKILHYLAESGIDPKGQFRIGFLQAIDSNKAPCKEEEQKAFMEAFEKLYSEIFPQAAQMKEALIKGDAENAILLLKQGFDPNLALLCEDKNRVPANLSYNVCCFKQVSLMDFALMHKRYQVAQYLADAKVMVKSITTHISVENLIQDEQIALLKYLAKASDENVLKAINAQIYCDRQYNSLCMKLIGLDQNNGLTLLISELELQLAKVRGVVQSFSEESGLKTQNAKFRV